MNKLLIVLVLALNGPAALAQNLPGPRPPSASPSLAPGLYVHVIDGLINLSNKGGSQSYSTGQFGYTANFSKPPAMLPKNPGMQFAPPPMFIPAATTAAASSGAKPNMVECEVR